MRQRGYTFIEVMITAAIVATLASMALPLAELAVRRSQESDLRRALRDIRDALDAYKRATDEGRILRTFDQSGYPPNLTLLVEGVRDAKIPGEARIYFLRRIPRDPFASTEAPAESTWGLRSYESPPDSPRSGKDVFDVHSLSAGVGLNGIPYRQW
jgi:general secretion pathway protein G